MWHCLFDRDTFRFLIIRVRSTESEKKCLTQLALHAISFES